MNTFILTILVVITTIPYLNFDLKGSFIDSYFFLAQIINSTFLKRNNPIGFIQGRLHNEKKNVGYGYWWLLMRGSVLYGLKGGLISTMKNLYNRIGFLAHPKFSSSPQNRIHVRQQMIANLTSRSQINVRCTKKETKWVCDTKESQFEWLEVRCVVISYGWFNHICKYNHHIETFLVLNDKIPILNILPQMKF